MDIATSKYIPYVMMIHDTIMFISFRIDLY
jgi:hypothetical protein